MTRNTKVAGASSSRGNAKTESREQDAPATLGDMKVAGASSSRGNTKTESREQDAPATLVPKLRFPEFRASDIWERLTLKQVTTALLDGDWIESKDQSDSGYRLIQTGNIGVGEFIAKSGKARYVSEETFARLRCTEIFPGDCLVSRLPDPAGRSCFIPDIGEKMITAVDCTIVRFDQTKIVPYLFIAHSQTDGYFCEVAALSSGSTRQRISRENLSGLSLPLPPTRAEQQKIAKCLSSLDELMAAQAQKVDALKTHKKGLMQQLFPKVAGASSSSKQQREQDAPTTFQPRLRFPEFQNAGEWEVTTIGDLKPFVTSGSRGWASFYADQGELFVRITNMWRDSIYLDLADSKYVQLPPGANEGVRTQLQVHDVLISITADIGIVSYVDDSIPSPAYINQHIALVRFDEQELSGKYVAYFLVSERSQQLFRASTDTGTKAGMSLIGIQKIGLMLPSLPEQQRITTCLNTLDAQITAETHKLETLKTHKKGLMQQLFPSPEAV